MIHRIRIRGLGPFVDCDARLGPLTMLLGPNASGKTFFLRSLVLLSKILRAPLRGPERPFRVDHATLDDLVARGRQDGTVELDVWTDDPEGQPNYSVGISKVDGMWAVTRESLRQPDFVWSSDQPLQFGTERRGMITWATPGEPPRHATAPYLVFPFRNDRIAGPKVAPFMRLVSDIGFAFRFRPNPEEIVNPRLSPWIDPERPFLDSSGAGFPHVFQRWHQTVDGSRVFQEAILPRLRQLFPHIQGVGLRTEGEKRLLLEYKTDRSDRTIPASLESDGVNLALFYLSLPHLVVAHVAEARHVPIAICFEEPEAGTHPSMQRMRFALLQEMVDGKLVPREFQVLASSHSVDIVRSVGADAAVNVLRFVEYRDEARGSCIHQIASRSELDRILALWDGDVGAAWFSNAFSAGGPPSMPEPPTA